MKRKALVAAASALAAGGLLLLKSRKKTNETPFALPNGFIVTSHSGSLDTKDNSIESVAVGLENADATEVDVTFAADGTPMLFHGDTPPVDAVPLAKAFELLKAHPDKQMNLDLKRFHRTDNVQALAEEYGVLGQVFFTGVVRSRVDEVRAGAPNIPYYLNCKIVPFLSHSRAYAASLVRAVRKSGAVGLNCDYHNATPTIVNEMHHAGRLVSLWTVNERPAIERVLRLAPDNVTSRRPDLVKEVLGSIR